MKVIILVAGRGTRLREEWAGPKCLVDVGGQALLTRYLKGISSFNLPVRIVTGYKSDDIKTHVDSLNLSIPVEFRQNDRFELGSVLSLQIALEGIEEPILLLDGDVLFHPQLLQQFIECPHKNALLVDPESSFTNEEYMVGGEKGRAAALQRGAIENGPSIGEWVGFARLGKAETVLFKQAVDNQVAQGDVKGGYEDSLGSLLEQIPFHYELIHDLPWVEIDFVHDLKKARDLVKSFPKDY